MKKEEPKIKVAKDGPYLISGNIPLTREVIVADKEGTPEKWKQEKKLESHENCALCRCGASKNKPFCDGTHVKIKFDGTENASSGEKYLDNAEEIDGPNLILQDNAQFCVGAGFCHRAGDVWNLTQQSGNSTARKIAIEEACNCPSGRLVVLDKKTKKPIETVFKPSIAMIEHPNHLVSGPLWVRGGISIESSEGNSYEKRNRVTLCRCGKSNNKPFCDGTHIDVNFKDENA